MEDSLKLVQHHQFGEILEFLLNSFRAKLTICSKNSIHHQKHCSPPSADYNNPYHNSNNSNGNGNIVEECPFNFNQFLAKGKEIISCPQLKQKLLKDLQIIQREGLVDSIIPYLISFTRHSSLNRFKAAVHKSNNPTFAITSGSITNDALDNSNNISICAADITSKSSKNDSNSQQQQQSQSISPDYPIIIHISDELKGIYQDFQCQQSILIQEMGYFSLIISKGQKLHEMDITIHCDVAIFEWLMKWISFHTNQSQESPELDAINVVGLTVSADFLQMSTLKNICLKYLSTNIQEILDKSPNLGCLSDSLLAEFSQCSDVDELETMIAPFDRLDRITSKLYTHFIYNLNNSIPNNDMGHYSSTASLFQCKLCNQLIINAMAIKVICRCMKYDWQGKLFSCHERNENWTFGNFIIELKRELKSWRKVYWRLWGTVHFFKCSTCGFFFPATVLKDCRYHSEAPKFLIEVNEYDNNNEGSKGVEKAEVKKSYDRKMSYSVESPSPPGKEYIYKPYGKYPCCKAVVYKYQTSPDISGCKKKEHTISDVTEASQILYKYKNLIVLEPETPFNKPLSSNNNIIQLSIGKPPQPIHLMPSTSISRITRGEEFQSARRQQSRAELDSSASDDEDSSTESSENNVPSSGFERKNATDITFPYPGTSTSYSHDTWAWNNELSTRYNQDMQREMEEKLMLNLTLFLSQRVPIDNNFDLALSQFNLRNTRQRFNLMNQENTGSFVKLEQLWLEEQSKQQHGRSGGSNVNSIF